MNQAVFLDRNGVITQEPPYYAHQLDQLALIDGSVGAMHSLNQNGFIVVVISNQAGVAHSYYREGEVITFNKAMKEILAEDDAHIDAIYYCPHHPEAKITQYRLDCNCRKPKPGMLIKAEKELNINLKQSFIIGDKLSDIQAGTRAGCKTVMVKMGYGQEEKNNNQITCDYIADDLPGAVEYILCLSGKLSIKKDR